MSAGVVVAAVSAASCSRPPQPARRGGRRISECLPRRSRGDKGRRRVETAPALPFLITRHHE